MATTLKRVNLMLDDAVVVRLRREARKRRVSMSELARTLLARGLGQAAPGEATLERIRRLRDEIGPVPDSTALIREARDRGW